MNIYHPDDKKNPMISLYELTNYLIKMYNGDQIMIQYLI